MGSPDEFVVRGRTRFYEHCEGNSFSFLYSVRIDKKTVWDSKKQKIEKKFDDIKRDFGIVSSPGFCEPYIKMDLVEYNVDGINVPVIDLSVWGPIYYESRARLIRRIKEFGNELRDQLEDPEMTAKYCGS